MQILPFPLNIAGPASVFGVFTYVIWKQVNRFWMNSDPHHYYNRTDFEKKRDQMLVANFLIFPLAVSLALQIILPWPFGIIPAAGYFAILPIMMRHIASQRTTIEK